MRTRGWNRFCKGNKWSDHRWSDSACRFETRSEQCLAHDTAGSDTAGSFQPLPWFSGARFFWAAAPVPVVALVGEGSARRRLPACLLPARHLLVRHLLVRPPVFPRPDHRQPGCLQPERPHRARVAPARAAKGQPPAKLPNRRARRDRRARLVLARLVLEVPKRPPRKARAWTEISASPSRNSTR